MSPLHVQGHRGACSALLENTLPSFRRAFDMGADSIELDVHVTKDRALAVYHDFCLNRFCCRGPGGRALKKSPPLYGLTLSEIQTHDCVDEHRLSVPNSLSPEERKIPSLPEVFALFRAVPDRATPFLIDIELKSDANQPQLSAPPPLFVKLVGEAVSKFWNWDRTVLRSFDERILREIKRQWPSAQVAALTPERFHLYEKVMEELHPEIVAPDYKSIHASDIRNMHALGAKVIPYTVNDPKDWERLIGMGVDGITTDDPAGLLRFLGRV